MAGFTFENIKIELEKIIPNELIENIITERSILGLASNYHRRIPDHIIFRKKESPSNYYIDYGKSAEQTFRLLNKVKTSKEDTAILLMLIFFHDARTLLLKRMELGTYTGILNNCRKYIEKYGKYSSSCKHYSLIRYSSIYAEIAKEIDDKENENIINNPTSLAEIILDTFIETTTGLEVIYWHSDTTENISKRRDLCLMSH